MAVRGLIEVGKLFKSSAGGKATLYDLARIGYKNRDFAAKRGSEDDIELNYIRRAVRYAVEHNNCPHPFYSDATASGLQVLALLLMPKNEATAQILNLRSENEWYDTYEYIVKLFLEKADMPQALLKYFTRKTLKRTIMILNYNGTPSTCFRSFVEAISESYGGALESSLVKDLRR